MLHIHAFTRHLIRYNQKLSEVYCRSFMLKVEIEIKCYQFRHDIHHARKNQKSYIKKTNGLKAKVLLMKNFTICLYIMMVASLSGCMTTRTIEVQETNWPGGNRETRIDGYKDKEGNFIRHGVSLGWYDSGQKRMEIHFADGVEHGLRTVWYETGQMWSQGHYVHGREDDVWTAWWANGFKQREWHMILSKWHGTFTEWHQNGEKKIQFEYRDGKKQGPFTIWDEQGNVFRKGTYVDNVEQPL